MLKFLVSALTLASSIFFVSLTTESALADRRVALVIGNAQYKNTNLTLPNPKNDADDVAATLRALGFEVVLATNADKQALDQAMQQFARRVTDADSALFFYAGHAMQYQGRNYLMPVDAELEDEISLRYQMIALDDVRAALDRANGVKIMILDACRNNPMADRMARNLASASRNVGNVRGLARIDKTSGMVVAYATAADDVAQDGTGRNSPFTSALLKRMQEAGVEIEIMFRRVTADVNTQTFGRQRPETYISLLSEYYLNQLDKMAWDKIKDSGNVAAIRDFVAKYPTSILTAHAQAQLASLDRTDREKQVDREKAQREAAEMQNRVAMLERERADRERADRERADRQKAEAAQLASIEADKQAAERAKAALAVAERETAERDRLARVEADRRAEDACRRDEQRLTAINSGNLAREDLVRFEQVLTCERLRPLVLAAISGLSEGKTRVIPAPPTVDTPLLVTAAQVELRRIGCFSGRDDGKLTDETRAAIKRYLTQRGRPSDGIKIDDSLVAELKMQDKGVCALDCKRGQVEDNGRCVASTRHVEPRRTKKPERQREREVVTHRTPRTAVAQRRPSVNDSEPNRPPVNDSAPSGLPIGAGRFGGIGIHFGRR